MENVVDLRNRLLKNDCRVGHGSSLEEIRTFETKNGICIHQNIRRIFAQIGPIELYSSWIIINIWSITDWQLTQYSSHGKSLFIIGDIMLDSDFLISAIESDKNTIQLNSDLSTFSADIYILLASLTRSFD